jgi:hypothetical protein
MPTLRSSKELHPARCERLATLGRERASAGRQLARLVLVVGERQRRLSSDARSAARAGAMRLPPLGEQVQDGGVGSVQFSPLCGSWHSRARCSRDRSYARAWSRSRWRSGTVAHTGPQQRAAATTTGGARPERCVAEGWCGEAARVQVCCRESSRSSVRLSATAVGKRSTAPAPCSAWSGLSSVIGRRYRSIPSMTLRSTRPAARSLVSRLGL